jgi:hypothetical protein
VEDRPKYKYKHSHLHIFPRREELLEEIRGEGKEEENGRK